MTIINPSSKFRLNFFYLGLILAVLFLGGFYIYQHNFLVSLRHGIEVLEKDLLAVQNQDSDLKNKFYALIDSGQLEELAQGKGLVLDKNPKYLNLEPLWVSASQ